jgi:hypothetical protein
MSALSRAEIGPKIPGRDIQLLTKLNEREALARLGRAAGAPVDLRNTSCQICCHSRPVHL